MFATYRLGAISRSIGPYTQGSTAGTGRTGRKNIARGLAKIAAESKMV